MVPGMKYKAIGLISGGLDSLLAAKIIEEQNIEVIGVTFLAPFWNHERILSIAKANNIPMKVLDIREEHFEIVKNPKYGYGSNMNPCIDCHGLMLKKAGELMEREGASFVFTGEVLGQRPMSQRRDALKSVEKLSGYEGKILRPLSAKLLPPTEPELKGIVDRTRLLGISGRGRKEQLRLADYYGIVNYETPSGGCLLTKEGYAKKLKTIMDMNPSLTYKDAELISLGRVMILNEKVYFFLGRNRQDNESLIKKASERDFLFSTPFVFAPVGLIPSSVGNSVTKEVLKKAASIVAAFSDASLGSVLRVDCKHLGRIENFEVKVSDKMGLYDLMIK